MTISPKPLTPQEFEDRYLSRPAEQPKAEKEATAERNDIRQALSKRTDIIKLFEPSEGVEKRVQEYYDSAFDRAFEGKTTKVLFKDSVFNDDDLDEDKWHTERLKANGIFWGGIIKENGKRDIDIDKVDITLRNGEMKVTIRGVISLTAIEHYRTSDGQMNYCAYPGPPPIAVLRMKPLSWKFAAINMAGATSRIHFLNSQVNADEARRMFLQEMMAISVQMDLADYLFNGTLSANIRSTLEKVVDIRHFISKVHIKKWSRAQAGVIFGSTNPSLGKDEELMKAWLCRVAVLRYFAHRNVGEKAEAQAKLNEFGHIYSLHWEEFKI